MNIEKMKQLRISKGLSQEDVAKLLGVSQVFYYYVESGTRIPSVPVLKQLATVLGCKVDDLLN